MKLFLIAVMILNVKANEDTKINIRYIVPITNLKMKLKSTIYNSIKTPLLVGLILKRQTHKQD